MKFFSKIFKNKSMVTLIAMIVCLAILYFAYNYRVNKAINAISVPVAKQRIEAREQISSDMITTKKVARAMITADVIVDKEYLVDKYVNYNTFIPEGSLFYKSAVVTWDSMPDSFWKKIDSGTEENGGKTIVSLAVNATMTFGNSIYPGDYIDLYYKNRTVYGGESKLFIGKLFQDIKVLAVKDVNGNHIFTRSADQAEAAALIFQVDECDHLLLKRALYIAGGSLFPVPRQHAKDYQYDTSIPEVQTNYIKKFIESNSTKLDSDPKGCYTSAPVNVE